MPTTVITGASRGIGRETAKVFAQENYNVVVNYNKSEKAAVSLKQELLSIGANVEIFKADVSNYEQARALIDFSIEKFDAIDVLVNNCGVSQYSLFTDCKPSDFENILQTNVISALNCSNLALPHMIRKHSGNIINISSIWGIVGASCEVLYSTSKAALIGFTKALAKEVAPSSINVNCVAPGAVNTDMMKEFSFDEINQIEKDIPMGRLANTNEIAKIVLFLTSNAAKYITGQVISPNGGWVV